MEIAYRGDAFVSSHTSNTKEYPFGGWVIRNALMNQSAVVNYGAMPAISAAAG